MPSAARLLTVAMLVLDPTWYSIVRPFEYVESRRFDAGWNRGADVLVAGGRVRSPVAGDVRFAGRVAGREVVTVATRVGGEHVIVTFTGLANARARSGDHVDPGEVIGDGTFVHVGAYDQHRRSRYLPVVLAPAGAVADPGAGAIATRVGRSGSPLADAVAERLRAAILGEELDGAAAGQAPPFTRPAASPRVRTGSEPRPGARLTIPTIAWARHVGRMSPAERGGRHPTAGFRAWSTTGPPRIPGERRDRRTTAPFPASASSWTELDAAERSAPTTPSRAVGIDVETPDGDRATSAGADQPPVVTHGSPRAPASPPAAHARAHAPATERVEHAAVVGDDMPVGRIDASSIVALVVALLGLPLLGVPLLVAWLRRRRRHPERPRELHQPLPVHLPHVRPYAYPVVRSDGSSVLPDIALAWSDPEPGTDPGPEPFARAAPRAPEHA